MSILCFIGFCTSWIVLIKKRVWCEYFITRIIEVFNTLHPDFFYFLLYNFYFNITVAAYCGKSYSEILYLQEELE
jgi:hypothetical protein